MGVTVHTVQQNGFSIGRHRPPEYAQIRISKNANLGHLDPRDDVFGLGCRQEENRHKNQSERTTHG